MEIKLQNPGEIDGEPDYVARHGVAELLRAAAKLNDHIEALGLQVRNSVMQKCVEQRGRPKVTDPYEYWDASRERRIMEAVENAGGRLATTLSLLARVQSDLPASAGEDEGSQRPSARGERVAGK